ncbi:unnamed protein product [Orchesella dallaii]|uniref:Ionotropic glutamate receptor C-terminal domain-containing protein n=1 Tax=Orchesella dallaii TaxID=48710 RepID=A0ABP1Q1Y7_9HEXA
MSFLFIATIVSFSLYQFPFSQTHSFNTRLSSQVISQHYPHCSLILITTLKSPSKIQEVSDLQLKLHETYSNYNSILLVGLLTVKTLSGKRDVRKHTSYCKLTVTFVEIKTKNTFPTETFFNLLTPPEGEMTKRDVDPYIFLTSEKSGENEILTTEIGTELKYKILITPDPSPKILTYCLYCEKLLFHSSPEDTLFEFPLQSPNIFPDLSRNWHHHPVRLSGATKYISLFEMYIVNGQYRNKRGMYVEIFEALTRKLNWTYTLHPCPAFGSLIPEGNTGTLLPNGTWAGCVADLLSKNSDLTCGANVNEDRVHVVDFTSQIRYDYVLFFSHKPQIIYPWTMVFSAFDVYGWILVGVSGILCSLLIYKMEKIMDNSNVGENSFSVSFPTFCFYLYGYLVSQGMSVEPNNAFSSKVTYVSWLFYGIVVGTAYAGGLQSLIVSPGSSVIPSTMPELLQSNFRWGAPFPFMNGLGGEIFRHSRSPVIRQIYKGMEIDKDDVRCLEKAALSDYVCFHYEIMVEYYIGTRFQDKAGNHPFLLSKDNVLFTGPTWMTRKREIFKEAVNDFFRWSFNMGLIHQIYWRDQRNQKMKFFREIQEGKRKATPSYNLDNDGPKPFTFDNVRACFIILGLGILLSAVVFGKEVWKRTTYCKIKGLSIYNIDLASKISNKYFKLCSIIVVTSNSDPSQVSPVSDYVFNLNFKSERSIFLIGLQTMKELRRENDLRQLSSCCKLVVTFVEDIDIGKSFPTGMFLTLLTPREHDIVRRDQDHFIFLSSSNSLNEAMSLLNSDISLELRYKILIMPPISSKVLMFCLYCDSTLNSPEQSVIQIQLKTNDELPSSSSLFPDFTSNFHHHPLRVVGPTRYISVYEMELINGHYHHKRGFYKGVFYAVQRKLNFTFVLHPCSGFGNLVSEGNTGVMLSNGTWAGCVSDVLYRRADLSIGGTPAEDRIHYVDFTPPLRYTYILFYTHKPRVFHSWTVVFQAFDQYGWALVLISIMSTGVALYKMERFAIVDVEARDQYLSSILLYLYAYLVMQSLKVKLIGALSKVTFIFWLFYGIVVTAAYFCSLQSLIVSPGIGIVPTTMPELVLSNFKWGAPLSFKNGLGEVILRNSKVPVMRQIYESLEGNKDAELCLEKAAVSDYACFHWDLMVDFFIGTRFIDKTGGHPFVLAKDNVLFSTAPWMTRKREIFRDVLNAAISGLYEMGIIEEIFARDRRAVRRELVEEVNAGKRKPLKSYTILDSGPQPFTTDNVKACFIVLGAGLLLACILLSKEIFKTKLMKVQLILRLIIVSNSNQVR